MPDFSKRAGRPVNVPHLLKCQRLSLLSSGGTHPIACVSGENSHPWIAKLPSRREEINVGTWEYLVYQVAKKAEPYAIRGPMIIYRSI